MGMKLNERPAAVLCCAMEQEYEGIVRHFPTARDFEGLDGARASLLSGGAGGPVLLCTGVGANRARAGLQQLLQSIPGTGMVFSCGIAGILDRRYDVGDVIVSHTVWHRRGEGADLLEACPAPPDRVCSALPYAIESCGGNGRAAFGAVLTSDQPVADGLLAERLHRLTSAACVEMEAAGIASLCRARGIPFLSVKIMSDFADENALWSMLRHQRRLTDRLGGFLRLLCEKSLLL